MSLRDGDIWRYLFLRGAQGVGGWGVGSGGLGVGSHLDIEGPFAELAGLSFGTLKAFGIVVVAAVFLLWPCVATCEYG
jgi:hypothetical protein